MSTAEQSVSLDAFDLLPRSFCYQSRIRQALCGWLTILCALVAILCGVATATAMRTHRTRQMRKQMAAAAIPLLDLRRDVIRLQQENSQRNQWCQAVEASRPDDSLLQTLAAIAAASRGVHHDILIDTLHLRVPIEYPLSAENTPDWAIPLLAITAHVLTDDAVQQWVDRLNRCDRIESASIHAATELAQANASSIGEFRTKQPWGSVQLTAIPLATRVLP